MKKLAWTARGVAAVSGALLVGVLAAPPAAADSDSGVSFAQELSDSIASSFNGGSRCGPVGRDVSSAVVDFGGSDLFETEFRAATDRWGHAFLNDSRNPGVWINLALVAGAPSCTVDTSLAVTESDDPGHLFITLLAGNGVIYRAQCDTVVGTPFTPENIAAACGAGFAAVPGTPV
ncbi:hypothetical protein FBY35_0210 [Streptomyces sp. SLBN-118]|uniref:hypothetical protein n=1 Tax=Streptomyces sp. SLBN-118 TaxID=2768454 RepID=UPI00114D9ABE|nr:hypothetical protein [Streptomyces sp. SLBN-118]TQK49921.1 hypothetical protein FBY35_0210 [Streptomyces sp. SLBN-118]